GSGRVEVGDFIYSPAAVGDVEANQLQNTAIGSIMIGTSVSDFVRRATALELERSGLEIVSDAPLMVTGDVKEFLLDDLGYSVDWSYSINYRLQNAQSGEPIIDKLYKTPTVTTGKFGLPSDLTPSINQMILNSLEQFIRDVRESGVFTEETSSSGESS
ncbi:MAG: hypothetical protein AAGC81_18725, partial [Pseudomonadota bacterium]